MYYITNQNNQIIAIDSSLLTLLEVNNIDELYRKIALEDIVFSSSEEEITIVTPLSEESYTAQRSELSGILGSMTLIQIQISPEKPSLIDNDISTLTLTESSEKSSILEDEDESVEDLLNVDLNTDEKISLTNDDLFEDDIFILDDTEKEVQRKDAEEQGISLLTDDKEESSTIKDETDLIEDLLNLDLDTDQKTSLTDDGLISIRDTDDLFKDNTFVVDDSEKEIQGKDAEEEISLLTDDSIDDEESKVPSDTEENDDLLFDLILPDTPEKAIDEISIDKISEEEEKDTSPIFIDIENISQQIGISTKDYTIFLNEYIDTALSLEEDLLSTQEEKYSNAIDTLSHLSNVLHLDVLSEIVTQIENTTAESRNRYIESFYTTLTRLTTTQADTHKEDPQLLGETESITVATESFGTISLDEVQSIHFDFQVEEASNDLALPVELIEEFVHDFIEQAHTETKKMLEAYEKGDLESIQNIGHLLKGASSNLRIKALSDTLYEIQFCQDSSKLEDLIKQYWGHFLSLEMQMNVTSHTRK